MMCYCWWRLYGFSQTSQSTLVVLGPAETTQNMQREFNDKRVLSKISSTHSLTWYFSLWSTNLVTLLTSGSASRCERPTTNTRFLWTTRTLARCLRFSVTFCFFSFCFCFFSFFILWMSSCDRGLYTAGSSGYGYKNKRIYEIISCFLCFVCLLQHALLWLCPDRDNRGFRPLLFAYLSLFLTNIFACGLWLRFHYYQVLLPSPFCKPDRGRSRLCGCDANRSGRSGSRKCKGRSWHRQSPAAPCTEGTPWGRPLVQGCGTSYRAVLRVGSWSLSTELRTHNQKAEVGEC